MFSYTERSLENDIERIFKLYELEAGPNETIDVDFESNLAQYGNRNHFSHELTIYHAQALLQIDVY